MTGSTDSIAILPARGPVSGAVRPPGSKSITNRALVCAALGQGESLLRGALESEDTEVMIDSLRRLGLELTEDRSRHTIRVAGCGGVFPATQADLFVGNSGTTIRFLTAMLATARGRYRLDGVPRMRQRPIGDLFEALRSLGGDLVGEIDPHCPPVVIQAAGLRGGKSRIRGDISSQFLSGLLMAGPYAEHDVELEVDGELVSKPYVTMTVGVMRSFGISLDVADLKHFRIPAGQRYLGCEYDIEPDASAASYFWGTAAITGGRITVSGLSREALQGDVGFCECLAAMGCDVDYSTNGITVTGRPLRGIDVNMNAISDTVQTLAAVALFADSPTTIHGVAHIRHKETDRIGDLARELVRLGAEVEEFEDGLRIIPRPLRGTAVDTYRDHRMAMSLALVGLRIPGVRINDPGCTRKTYPEFFSDFAKLVGEARG